MKTWAWILGGVGVAAGAWWYFKGRSPETSATPESIYPEGVVPGVTPGYPIAPSVDELPPDPARQTAPAMGESYAPSTQQSAPQASTASTGYSEPATYTPSSSGAPYAVGAGTGTDTSSAKAPLFLVEPVAPKVVLPQLRPMVKSPSPMVSPKDLLPQVKPLVRSPMLVAPPKELLPEPKPIVKYLVPVAPPIVATPKLVKVAPMVPPPAIAPKPVKTTLVTPPIATMPQLVKAAPAKVLVTTYRSPVTSVTRTAIAPVLAAPQVVAPPKPKSPMLAPVVRPLTRPLAVIRPTNVRGVYAVGADFTEAEYHAMAVKAELESKRREWAANQMSEQTNAMNRINR